MKTKTITYQQLVDLEACDSQLALFKTVFGEQVVISPETLSEVLPKAAGFDIDWLAGRVLTNQARKAYEEARAQAWAVYNEATAPAWKAYREARAQAWAVYQEARAQALKVYEEARAQARKAYEEAIAPALKVYEEARAQAWKASRS